MRTEVKSALFTYTHPAVKTELINSMYPINICCMNECTVPLTGNTLQMSMDNFMLYI